MEFSLDMVPIKYILGTYIDSPGYPTPEDILYLMTQRSADKGKSLSPVKFTTTVLYKKVGEEYKENIEASLLQLEKDCIIERNQETKAGISFTILKNKFL